MRAEALGLLTKSDGAAGRPARAGQERRLATAGFNRHFNDVTVLGVGQEKKLGGAASGKQRTGAVGRESLQALGIGGWREVALGVEVGDRERQ